ncbi:UNVERIFIED_CONTAM: hypothetical protein K2H54_071461 [Gekko kuhli]
MGKGREVRNCKISQSSFFQRQAWEKRNRALWEKRNGMRVSQANDDSSRNLSTLWGEITLCVHVTVGQRDPRSLGSSLLVFGVRSRRRLSPQATATGGSRQNPRLPNAAGLIEVISVVLRRVKVTKEEGKENRGFLEKVLTSSSSTHDIGEKEFRPR